MSRDEYPGDEFTEDERRELRRIIQGERHMAWLWAMLRNLAIWVAAIVAGVYAFWDGAGALIRHLTGVK